MMIRKWLNRLKVEHGQSVLEYSAIAMMIMIGILVIGPYVVRSINAYFKGAEDQAHDSFREKIRQARLQGDELAYNLGDCHCEYKDPAVCSRDASLCPLTQLMKPLVCDPPGCLGPSSGPRAQCMMEELPATAKTWQECYVENNQMYPIGEDGYQQWRDDGCGYECCTEAELVAPHCYFFDDTGNFVFGGMVRYVAVGSHENSHEWTLDKGDRILNRADGKIYTVLGPKPLPEGAIAHWEFEGSELDSVGDYHGEISGDVNFVEGMVGQAASFDGERGNFIDISENDPDQEVKVEGDFTYLLWLTSSVFIIDNSFYVDSIDDYYYQVNNGVFQGHGRSSFRPPLLVFGKNALAIVSHGDSFVPQYLFKSFSVEHTAWTHVALVFDAVTSRGRVYVDGELFFDSNTTSWDDGLNNTWLPPLGLNIQAIGYRRFEGPPGQTIYEYPFNGGMDEFMVYDRMLTEEEVRQIYETQLRQPGEWDGDEVEWDEGTAPVDNMLVVDENTGDRWLYSNDTGWGLYTATNPGAGYVQMRRLCGKDGNVAQDFFVPEPENCQYSCGSKDARAFWCDPVSYNYGLTQNLEAKHVAYGECSDDNKCVAYCPDDSQWTYSDSDTLEVHESDGCVCRDRWEWNSETDQCDCLWPNTLVEGADGKVECELILGQCGCPPNGIGQPPNCTKHEEQWPTCQDGDQQWIKYTNSKTGIAVQYCVAAWCSDPYCQVEGQCGTYTGYGDFRCRTVKHDDCSAYERCPGFKNSAGGTSVNPCPQIGW